MALVFATLEAGLKRMQVAPPRTPAEAAERIATAYLTYARAAQASGIPPLLTGREVPRLVQALLPSLLNPNAGSVPRLANGLSSALAAFWLGVTFGPGVFTTFPSPVCAGCLRGFVGFAPAHVAARKLASCFHQATLASIVTFPPPIGPVPLL